jgi:hypothetical protein
LRFAWNYEEKCLLNKGVKYSLIIVLSIILAFMASLLVLFTPGLILILLGPIVFTIFGLIVIASRPTDQDGTSPIPQHEWRGQVADATPGNERQLQVWWFSLVNDDVKPQRYIKVVMKGDVINGPPPRNGDRFQITRGKWKDSQVHAREMKNLQTGAVTWV